MTKHEDDVRLYLDGNLQFMSLDEQRYHEALRYPIQQHFSGSTSIPKILILGGGDGLLVRTIKKYHPNYSGNIQLVELDPAMIQLAKENNTLATLNNHGLDNVSITNQDAYNYLIKHPEQYDAIICDFPDPRDIGLAKLYSKEIYSLIANHLTKEGIFVTHAGNAFFMREVFWTIHNTIKATEQFSDILPYHSYIPSFGDRGFITGIKSGTINERNNNPLIQKTFDPDYLLTPTCINSLDTPCIIFEYQKGQKRFDM
jgi:spermidine synthase